MSNTWITEKSDELRRELEEIELDVITSYKLSDAIREGSRTTEQCAGWGGSDNKACALTAAVIAAKARGYKV